MAMYTLLRNNPHPTEADILQACDGNMCRCTGNLSIAAALTTFASDIEDAPMCETKQKVVYNNDNEPQYKNELTQIQEQPLNYQWETISEETGERVFAVQLCEPKTLEELCEIYQKNSYAHIVTINGAAYHMLRTYCDISKHRDYILVDMMHIKEIDFISNSNGQLVIGGGVNYSDLQYYCQNNNNGNELL